MADAFDQAWSLVKYQTERHNAERDLEADPYAAVRTPLPVAGNKGNYTKFLRNIGDRLRVKEVYDPLMGGAAAGFAMRPYRVYVGNDNNPMPPSFLRRIKEEPEALRWNFDEEYGLKAGDVLRFKAPNPLDTRETVMPPVSEEMIDAWHEATGGLNVDSDVMLNIPWMFRQHLNRVNDLQNDPRVLEWNSPQARERDRLIGILQPQMIGGHFRLGEANIPGKNFINISTRGPPKRSIRDTERKLGSKADIFEDFWNEYVKRSQEAGLAYKTGKPSNPFKSKHFFYPYPKYQGMGRTEEQREDKKYHYDPWSQIMNDDNYIFQTGDYAPMMDEILPIVDPKTGAMAIDPPYVGDEVGEHRKGNLDWGEHGGFIHSLMENVRRFSDLGLPIIAFNSGDSGKSPEGRKKSDIMREMYGIGGLEYRQLQDRKNKGIAEKGSTQVGESIGTNIPWLTQDKITNLEQEYPVYDPGYRGSWRHNIFSTEPS